MDKFSKRTYNLEERTAKFGESVIALCSSLKIDSISKPLVSQIVRSATSIGANYMEANSASSKRDFQNKIYICKKECQETKHWLRMISFYLKGDLIRFKILNQELEELTLIFGKIVATLRKQSDLKIKNSVETQK